MFSRIIWERELKAREEEFFEKSLGYKNRMRQWERREKETVAQIKEELINWIIMRKQEELKVNVVKSIEWVRKDVCASRHGK